jgi:hypothetical protein
LHIDFYEKVSLFYRGSVLLPITFPFLPVHRLAFSVDIPGSDTKTHSCYNDQCVHGKCIKYSNNPVEDGLDDIAQFNILVIVHRIVYVLVFLLTMNPSVCVLRINLVFDVFLTIQYAIQHVKMGDNAFPILIIWYWNKSFSFFV